MLTEAQKHFLEKIPEDITAKINPWDKVAADFAKKLVAEIEKNSGLEVFWEGSLALGVAGENDIDLYIFSEPQHFEINLPGIEKTLGKPTYVVSEKILWRIEKEGHKIDASLISPNSPTVIKDRYFFTKLKNDPTLLKKYADLKIPGILAREYYKQKNEFYNEVVSDL